MIEVTVYENVVWEFSLCIPFHKIVGKHVVVTSQSVDSIIFTYKNTLTIILFN